MTEDPNVYVACDYSATGEGRSIMLLITRANVRRDLGDYEIEPCFDENGYNPGVLKTTAEQRAMREFSEKFSSYFAMGAEVLDRNEFFHRYEKHVPGYVYKLTDINDEHIPPGFNFYTSIHFNYS